MESLLKPRIIETPKVITDRVSWQQVKPLGASYKSRTYAYLPSSGKKIFYPRDRIRFDLNQAGQQGMWNPYSAYIDVEVEFPVRSFQDPTFEHGMVTQSIKFKRVRVVDTYYEMPDLQGDAINIIAYQEWIEEQRRKFDTSIYQLDGSGHSMISMLSIKSNNREVERIEEYDTVGQILYDVNMGVDGRKVNQNQGLGWQQIDTKIPMIQAKLANQMWGVAQKDLNSEFESMKIAEVGITPGGTAFGGTLVGGKFLTRGFTGIQKEASFNAVEAYTPSQCGFHFETVNAITSQYGSNRTFNDQDDLMQTDAFKFKYLCGDDPDPNTNRTPPGWKWFWGQNVLNSLHQGTIPITLGYGATPATQKWPSISMMAVNGMLVLSPLLCVGAFNTTFSGDPVRMWNLPGIKCRTPMNDQMLEGDEGLFGHGYYGKYRPKVGNLCVNSFDTGKFKSHSNSYTKADLLEHYENINFKLNGHNNNIIDGERWDGTPSSEISLDHANLVGLGRQIAAQTYFNVQGRNAHLYPAWFMVTSVTSIDNPTVDGSQEQADELRSLECQSNPDARGASVTYLYLSKELWEEGYFISSAPDTEWNKHPANGANFQIGGTGSGRNYDPFTAKCQLGTLGSQVFSFMELTSDSSQLDINAAFKDLAERTCCLQENTPLHNGGAFDSAGVNYHWAWGNDNGRPALPSMLLRGSDKDEYVLFQYVATGSQVTQYQAHVQSQQSALKLTRHIVVSTHATTGGKCYQQCVNTGLDLTILQWQRNFLNGSGFDVTHQQALKRTPLVQYEYDDTQTFQIKLKAGSGVSFDLQSRQMLYTKTQLKNQRAFDGSGFSGTLVYNTVLGKQFKKWPVYDKLYSGAYSEGESPSPILTDPYKIDVFNYWVWNTEYYDPPETSALHRAGATASKTGSQGYYQANTQFFPGWPFGADNLRMALYFIPCAWPDVEKWGFNNQQSDFRRTGLKLGVKFDPPGENFGKSVIQVFNTLRLNIGIEYSTLNIQQGYSNSYKQFNKAFRLDQMVIGPKTPIVRDLINLDFRDAQPDLLPSSQINGDPLKPWFHAMKRMQVTSDSQYIGANEDNMEIEGLHENDELRWDDSKILRDKAYFYNSKQASTYGQNSRLTNALNKAHPNRIAKILLEDMVTHPSDQAFMHGNMLDGEGEFMSRYIEAWDLPGQPYNQSIGMNDQLLQCGMNHSFALTSGEPKAHHYIESHHMINGKYQKQSSRFLNFRIPLLSGVLGYLMPYESYKLLPMVALRNVQVECYINPYAFFTSHSGMKREGWQLNKFHLTVEILNFGLELEKSARQLLAKPGGLRFHTESYYKSADRTWGKKQSPHSTIQVNMGFQSLKKILISFHPTEYMNLPYVRKQFRVSHNLKNLQARIGTERFPELGIRGHGGNSTLDQRNVNDMDNSEFYLALKKGFKKYLQFNAEMVIDKANFAINGRKAKRHLIVEEKIPIHNSEGGLLESNKSESTNWICTNKSLTYLTEHDVVLGNWETKQEFEVNRVDFTNMPQFKISKLNEDYNKTVVSNYITNTVTSNLYNTNTKEQLQHLDQFNGGPSESGLMWNKNYNPQALTSKVNIPLVPNPNFLGSMKKIPNVWLHENMYIGKAVYVIDFESIGCDQGVMGGVNTIPFMPYNITIESHQKEQCPSATIMHLFHHYNLMFTLNLAGIMDFGRA